MFKLEDYLLYFILFLSQKKMFKLEGRPNSPFCLAQCFLLLYEVLLQRFACEVIFFLCGSHSIVLKPRSTCKGVPIELAAQTWQTMSTITTLFGKKYFLLKYASAILSPTHSKSLNCHLHYNFKHETYCTWDKWEDSVFLLLDAILNVNARLLLKWFNICMLIVVPMPFQDYAK